ncbi:endonuclease [bacterium]|nr:endonuclease [bacterium]
MKYFIPILILSLSSLIAQIPEGYYDGTSGLSGTALQQVLHDIIDNHTVVSYSSLWTHYQTTDVKQNGKVWDMYSDIPGGDPPYEFTFVSDQCGNYGAEGDCYNREHSWPRSWFNDVPPMDTDIFHVVPSDGYVNGQRGNYPYGEVDSPNWTSLNGSKRGPCVYPGYSGTVFEPIDAYKGDFARIYFYMSTRYLNEDSGWSGSPMVNGAQLEPWALDMLLEWHAADAVSQKEIARNDAVYNIQNNRNPYVDHPEYADMVWEGVSPTPLAPSNLQAGDITETSLILTWTDNAVDEEGFYVYQNGVFHTTVGINGEFYMVSDLVASTSYTFGVSAFNAAGESSITSIGLTTAGGGGVTHFVEGFETGGGNGYIDGDFTLESGIWNAYQAGNFTLGTPNSGNFCIAINDDQSDAHLTTPSVNTLGNISFYYYQRNGSATDAFQILKSSNGGTFVTVTIQSYNVGESYTHFSYPVNDTAASVRIKILNDNQSAHLIIDDISMTSYEPVRIDHYHPELPDRLSLSPAYPNPFNPSTTLSFQVNKRTINLKLQIFNIHGELLDTPLTGTYAPGRYELAWTGLTSNDKELPSGIYLIRLTDGVESSLQRITLLR